MFGFRQDPCGWQLLVGDLRQSYLQRWILASIINRFSTGASLQSCMIWVNKKPVVLQQPAQRLETMQQLQLSIPEHLQRHEVARDLAGGSRAKLAVYDALACIGMFCACLTAAWILILKTTNCRHGVNFQRKRCRRRTSQICRHAESITHQISNNLPNQKVEIRNQPKSDSAESEISKQIEKHPC